MFDGMSFGRLRIKLSNLLAGQKTSYPSHLCPILILGSQFLVEYFCPRMGLNSSQITQNTDRTNKYIAPKSGI